MDVVASFLLLSIILQPGAVQSDDGPRIHNAKAINTTSEMLRYTFTLNRLESNNKYSPLIRVMSLTSERTCVNIPCAGDQSACLNESRREIRILSSRGVCSSTIDIFATDRIVVHGLLIINHEITGGFLALPHNYLGTKYLVDTYSLNKRTNITITSIQNDTGVSINCTNMCNIESAMITNQVVKISDASESITVEIVESTTLVRISSDKPVSVIVSARTIKIPPGAGNIDHGVLLEQLLPVSKWGRIHIVPPFINATNGWVVRYGAYDTNSTVILKDTVTGEVERFTLDSGQFRNYFGGTSQSAVCTIVSDKPIQVMQYMKSSRDDQPGDPSMVIVPPVRDYHGNVTLDITENVDDTMQHVDLIVAASFKDKLQINYTSIDCWRCFEINVSFTEESSLVQEYCYCHKVVPNGLLHVTHPHRSARFMVRLYAHSVNKGGAMLADLGSPPEPSATGNTTHVPFDGNSWRQRLIGKLMSSADEFQSYGDAERAMTGLTSYLEGKETLESVDEMNFTLAYFTSLLRRNPLKFATVNDTQSFLNMSSDALDVLFANKTNQLMADACKEKINLTSYPEDVQMGLESLAKDAAGIIVDGGIQSFGVRKRNAGIHLSSNDCGDAAQMTSSGVHLPCEVLQERETRAIYRIELPYAGEAVARSTCKFNSTEMLVATPLLGIGLVSSLPERRFSNNISLTFTVNSPEAKVNITEDRTLCSFWNYTESDWSTSGCTLEKIQQTDDGEMNVTCLCDHLTSFAVLVRLTEDPIPPVHRYVMNILTLIGCSFSIVACFLTCCGYAILRLKSDLILVHFNLAFAVGATEIVFLCLDLVSDPSKSQQSCTIVASLIYYFSLAMFAWMAIEGIHLYLLTFVVWNAQKRKIKLYMALGWGIPVLFLVVLLPLKRGVLGYTNGEDRVCFLGIHDFSLLFLLVPVGIVIVLNLIVTSRVVYQIVKMADGPTLQTDNKTRVRHGVKAMAVLLPIMGLTWIFAFMTISETTLVFDYIFLIINSLQGVFIFIIHFVRNGEVRHACRRRREKWMVSHSKQWDYRESNQKKSSLSAQSKISSSSKTPEQTMTLMKVHSDAGY